VVVIERDTLPPAGEHRRGVPHGRHLHALHPRGLEILNALFAGYAAGRAGFAVGMLVPAAERGLDLAGADAGPAEEVQARQDGAADVAGQVAGGTGDTAGGGDEVLRGLHGDLVARPGRGQFRARPGRNR
jgi:hypothetical protein